MPGTRKPGKEPTHMPRSKVSEDDRRRVAKACLSCRRTKQKCDGLAPCAACVGRGQDTSCAYSRHPRSYGARRRAQPRPVVDEASDQIPGTASSPANPSPPAAAAISGCSSRDHTSQMESLAPGYELFIPKLSRTLRDTEGNVSRCKALLEFERGDLAC